MRTAAMKSILAVSAVYMMGSVLQAQEHTVKAHIPFAFQVQSKMLPAGDYVVKNSPVRTNAELMDRKTGKRCYIPTSYGRAEGTGRYSMTFHRYGTTYFLAEIWTGDSTPGNVVVSKREKELMRSPRGAEMATVSVTVRAD